MSGVPASVDSEWFTVELTGPAKPPSFDASAIDTITLEALSDGSITLELPVIRAEPRPSDRREKPREVIRALARICIDGDTPLEVQAVDLSAHGIAVTAKRPLNVNQECRIELGISAPELARPPELRASIRYCARLSDNQYRIGMKFTKVSVEAAELIVAVLGL